MTALTDSRFVVLVGNYGSGKTELALNLALASAQQMTTTLVDLDIVNPYFRSGEKAEELKAAGVRVLMPTFAMSTVDIPALPAEIQSVFEQPSQRVIFDVGGDDTGAAALGRYAPSFRRYREDTTVCLVINAMRPLTQTAEDVVDLAQRIAARGRMNIDVIINNTNLADQTEPDMLAAGHQVAVEAAKLLGVSRVVDVAMPQLGVKDALPLTRHMAPDWMEDA
ncbi:MAG: ParA family protein [Clostridia bacterium]|nr:ParA family protein [Clostridia bacterium]